MKKYKVWQCRIVVPEDSKLPNCFDSPPRMAAKNAVNSAGIEIVACFSGWGYEVTETERKVLEKYKLD